MTDFARIVRSGWLTRINTNVGNNKLQEPFWDLKMWMTYAWGRIDRKAINCMFYYMLIHLSTIAKYTFTFLYIYSFRSVCCFKISYYINIHVFHIKMKIYRSSICYCLQSFDASGVNKIFLLNRTRVECIYILQSTCWASTRSKSFGDWIRSEKMTRIQCYRNDFGKFFQHWSNARQESQSLKSKFSVALRRSRANRLYSSFECTTSFSARRHHETSRSSKRPEDSITFYDPRDDSHWKRCGSDFEKFSRRRGNVENTMRRDAPEGALRS